MSDPVYKEQSKLYGDYTKDASAKTAEIHNEQGTPTMTQQPGQSHDDYQEYLRVKDGN